MCPGLGGPGETRGRRLGPEPPGWVRVRPFSLSRRRVVCAGCSLGPRRGSGAGQRAGARRTVGRTRASRGCGSRAPVGSASTSCRSNACSPARRSLSCAGGPSCPLLVRLYGVDQVPPPWNLVSRVHCGKTKANDATQNRCWRVRLAPRRWAAHAPLGDSPAWPGSAGGVRVLTGPRSVCPEGVRAGHQGLGACSRRRADPGRRSPRTRGCCFPCGPGSREGSGDQSVAVGRQTLRGGGGECACVRVRESVRA